MKKTFFLTNNIQNYHWGDTSSISSVLGRESGNTPEAELWMGTHPKGTSRLRDEERDLFELIKSDPSLIGNSETDSRGGLSFLFKLLAAGAPLSLQAHPNKSQAVEGYKRDNEAGIALDAFNRNYKDDNHKPEIICALSEYTAMKGFRKPVEIASFLKELDLDDSFSSFSDLQSDSPGALKAFYSELMKADEMWKKEKVEYIKNNIPSRACPEWSWVKKLSEFYPDDIGILAPVFLNLIILQPGEALFLPAGELHAYLNGFGVELMAASDNVLRGGLTSKYMDVHELMAVLNFVPADTNRISVRKESEHCIVYPVPVDDFLLRKYEGENFEIILPPDQPSLSIVLDGEFVFEDGKTKAVKGDSFFNAACSKPELLKGSGVIYTASPGVGSE